MSTRVVLILALSALTVIAVTLFVRTLSRMISTYMGGQPLRRNDRPGRRTLTLLQEALLSSRLKQQPVGALVASAHWVILVSFFVLFLTLVTAYGQLITPDFTLPWLGHFAPFLWLVEILAWLMVASIVFLIVVRLTRQPKRQGRSSRFFGSTMWQAYYVELTILVVGLCVLGLHALEYAIGQAQGESWANTTNFPLTAWLGSLFAGASATTLSSAITVVATIKITVSLAWLITLANQPTIDRKSTRLNSSHSSVSRMPSSA